MNISGEPTISYLTSLIRQITQGDYKAAQHLFDATADKNVSPEYQELSESLGLMSVKIEAREFDLERKIEEIGKQKNELKHLAELRAESGFLFCSIILMLCAYTLVLSAGLSSGWITPRMETAITVGLLLILTAIFGSHIRRHHHPWAIWGLTQKGSRKALLESLLWSAPMALAVIWMKCWLVGQAWSSFYGQTVFNWKLSPGVVAMYSVGAIAQEIVSRGFIQTTIERVLVGKQRGIMAIITSSVLFAVAHLHYSQMTMLATMFGGFFFGWLYRRHQTLIGVIVAHILLGILVLDILRLIG